MKTVRVIALKDHLYDDEPRQTGESYEAAETVLQTLVAVGFVKVADVSPAAPQNAYKRRDLRAEK